MKPEEFYVRLADLGFPLTDRQRAIRTLFRSSPWNEWKRLTSLPSPEKASKSISSILWFDRTYFTRFGSKTHPSLDMELVLAFSQPTNEDPIPELMWLIIDSSISGLPLHLLAEELAMEFHFYHGRAEDLKTRPFQLHDIVTARRGCPYASPSELDHPLSGGWRTTSCSQGQQLQKSWKKPKCP